jgi:3D (Asp-Asp-Asp) domain-containing protein
MNDNGEIQSASAGLPERKPLLSNTRFKNVSLHQEQTDSSWYEAVEDQSSIVQTVSTLQNYNFNNYQNMNEASINIPVITPGAARSIDNIQSQGEFPTTNWQRYGSRLVDLGDFTLTAYDACMLCCGKTDGITATRTKCFAGRTIAVDPNVIPYGSKVLIGGFVFIAEDTGGKIKGKHIDMYMDTHETAKLFGRRKGNVQLIVD